MHCGLIFLTYVWGCPHFQLIHAMHIISSILRGQEGLWRLRGESGFLLWRIEIGKHGLLLLLLWLSHAVISFLISNTTPLSQPFLICFPSLLFLIMLLVCTFFSLGARCPIWLVLFSDRDEHLNYPFPIAPFFYEVQLISKYRKILLITWLCFVC